MTQNMRPSAIKKKNKYSSERLHGPFSKPNKKSERLVLCILPMSVSIKQHVIKKGEPYRYTDLAIGKRDLIKMKYRAERQMRDVLRILFDEVIENPAINNRDYLLKRAKNLKNKH